MSLTFAQHQKTYSIRLMEQLKRPPLHSLALFNLPRNSALHFIEYGDEGIGIDEDHFLLSNQKDDIAVSFLVKHTHELEGKAFDHTFNSQTAINDYFTSHRRFKRLDKQPNLLNNERILAVYNYGILDNITAYPKVPQTIIHRYRNNLKSMLDNCLALCKTGSRQHYLLLEVPSALPSIPVLKRAADMTDNSIIKRFYSYANFQVGELWNWLSHNRDHSVLGAFDNTVLSRINIVIKHAGMWGVFNLGVVNNWRFTDPKEKTGPGISRLSPDVISVRFLNMLMIVSQTTTDVPDSEHYDEIDKAISSNDDADSNSEDDSERSRRPVTASDVNNSLPRESSSVTGYASKPLSTSVVSLINKGVSDDTLKTDAEIIDEIGEIDDNNITDDLKALERLEENDTDLDNAATGYTVYTPPNEDLARGITDAAMESVRKGRLSAAEFRRFEKLANRYKEIKNPFNPDEKLSDMITVSPEILKVAELNPLADDIKGVIDKSMLSSSIKEMDKRYIDSVLRKDVAAMVVNFQKMGFAVQDFTVERVEDYTDNLEVYTVKIVPVSGKPSTVRFKLPVVNENGTFKAGGVKYRMRKQRGD